MKKMCIFASELHPDISTNYITMKTRHKNKLKKMMLLMVVLACGMTASAQWNDGRLPTRNRAWRQKMNETNPNFFKTDEARRMMDDRMILTDDVIGVLDGFRESGEDMSSSVSAARSSRTKTVRRLPSAGENTAWGTSMPSSSPDTHVSRSRTRSAASRPSESAGREQISRVRRERVSCGSRTIGRSVFAVAFQ